MQDYLKSPMFDSLHPLRRRRYWPSSLPSVDTITLGSGGGGYGGGRLGFGGGDRLMRSSPLSLVKKGSSKFGSSSGYGSGGGFGGVRNCKVL